MTVDEPESPEPQDELAIAEPEDTPEPPEETTPKPSEDPTPEASEAEHEELPTATVDEPASKDSEPSGTPKVYGPLEPLYAVPEDDWEGFTKVTYKKRFTYSAPGRKPVRTKRMPSSQTAPLAALRPLQPRAPVKKRVILHFSESSK